MKVDRQYEEVQVEVIRFENEDVISSSLPMEQN